jgi:hypothetical protein
MATFLHTMASTTRATDSYRRTMGARTSFFTTARSAARDSRASLKVRKVEYEVEQGPKGPQAKSVSVVASV